MTTPIKLPPLPEQLHHPELRTLDAFTREQVCDIQLAAMRHALEEAAKVLKKAAEESAWEQEKHVLLYYSNRILALKIEGET